MKLGLGIALVLAFVGCDRTVIEPGKAARIHIDLRAAKNPDALGGPTPVGSLELLLETTEPQQSACAFLSYTAGKTMYVQDEPFEDLLPSANAHLTIWGDDPQGNRISVGRSGSFILPEEGDVDVFAYLGRADDWSLLGADPAWERLLGSAVHLGGGEVLLAGGLQGVILNDAALYRHRTGLIEPIAAAPLLVAMTVVAVGDGRAILAGGADLNNALYPEVWLYENGAFTIVGTGHAHAFGMAAWFPDSQLVWLMGGLDGAGIGLDTITQVDLRGSSVVVTTAAQRLPEGRAGAVVTQVTEGVLAYTLLTGGLSDTSVALASAVYLEDQGAGVIRIATPAPGPNPASLGDLLVARWQHIAVPLATGDVFVYGGSDASGTPLADPSPVLFSPVIQDPGGFLPVAGPADPTLFGARVGAVGAPLAVGDTRSILIAGGAGLDPADARTVRFTPRANQEPATDAEFRGDWSALPDGAPHLAGIAVPLPGGEILVLGGSVDSLVGTPAPGAEIFVPTDEVPCIP